MEITKMQELTTSINYNGEMTVATKEESLHIVNEAFAEFSPQVTSVSTGSLIIDVVVPISCALLPILYGYYQESVYILWQVYCTSL